MKLVHYNPAELPYEVIHRFVMDYAFAYPEIFGSLDVDERARKLQDVAHTYAYVDFAGKIVAAIFFYCNDVVNHIAFITSIAKLFDAPIGAGGEMMHAYESYAKQVGMNLSRLEVSVGNSHAQNFYVRQGYVKKKLVGNNLMFEKRI